MRQSIHIILISLDVEDDSSRHFRNAKLTGKLARPKNRGARFNCTSFILTSDIGEIPELREKIPRKCTSFLKASHVNGNRVENVYACNYSSVN